MQPSRYGRLKAKVTEKEIQIASMLRKIEDLRRKAKQGSQQLQGEAQEIEIETAGLRWSSTKMELAYCAQIEDRPGTQAWHVDQVITSVSMRP